MTTIFRPVLFLCLVVLISPPSSRWIGEPPPQGVITASELSSELEKCSAGLVPNQLLTKHSNNSDEAFFDAMCGDWYESHNNVVDSHLGGTAIIEGVPTSGSASNTTTTKGLTRTQYCSQTDHRVSTKTKDTFWSSVVSDEARADWLGCIKLVTTHHDGQPHPIVITVQASDPNVVVSVLFNANFGGERPKFNSLEATNLICKDGTHGRHPVIPSQGAGLAFMCQWATVDASTGIIIVNTSRGAEIATAERILPPFLKVDEELHTPVTKVARTDTVCEPWFGTVDMDNWKKSDTHDGRCTKASDDGKWCKGEYGQTVTARSGGTLRNPRIECQGEACAWNDIARHSFWNSPTSGVTSISGGSWIGSHSVQIRVCADEDVPKTEDQVTHHASWILSKGSGFVVEVPKGTRAILNIRLNGGTTSAIEVGKSNNVLTAMGRAEVGDITKWSYLVSSR